MTRATSKARGAYQSARALRSLLQELFAQSLRQMELLECEDYDGLEDVVNRKGALMQMLPAALDACRAQGWNLQDPSTYPVDGPCAQWMCEAAQFSTRLQAHEKYCLGEMLARRSSVGQRLTVLLGKRSAAAGYRAPLTRGNRIDTAR
jgi:hypothetical protein